jgi:hypothetical protein
MFRPSLGHLQALKESRSKITQIFLQKHIVGSQMLTECYKGTVENSLQLAYHQKKRRLHLESSQFGK